jgi:hypothetical protein
MGLFRLCGGMRWPAGLLYAPRGDELYYCMLTPKYKYIYMLYFYSTPDLPMSIYLPVVILPY